MSYFRRPKGHMAGLGAYSDNEMKLPFCGNLAKDSTQICRSSDYQGGQGFGENRGLYYTAPSSSNSSTPSWMTDLLKISGALAVNKIAGSGSQPTLPVAPVQGGISSTTMLVAGGIGVLALVLLLK